MRIARYEIHLDALLARIIYRWHWKLALGAAGLLMFFGVITGHIPPFWKGAITLTITAPADAQVEVDGRSWPSTLYAGDHQIVARHADGRIAWAAVSLNAGDARAVVLPPGLPDPRERLLPVPAPGLEIAQVWWADGAWRVLSLPAPPSTDEGDTNSEKPTLLPGAGQTIAVGAEGMERLATLDAYAGLADQIHVDDRLVEAVFIPNDGNEYRNTFPGTIEVRGWGEATRTITATAPITLVRFAPTGNTLLFAEQVASGGEQVYLAEQGKTRVPVVAVPGQITRLTWRDDGTAVVLHSRQGERLTLTLVRFEPSIAAAVVADLPIGAYAGDLVPLTWNNTGLLWIAPDQDGPALWHAPLTALIPERLGPLDARALTSLPDGALRVVTMQEEQVVIGRYQEGLLIGEAVIPRVPATEDLAGTWHGDELLLQNGATAWLLDLSPDPTTAN